MIWRDSPLLLQQAREDDVALLLVLVTKLLAVGALLAPGPGIHLRSAHADEDGNGPVAAGDDDAHPRQDLEHVVGAGDEPESVARRDLALSAARRSQRRQIQVHRGVAHLSKQVEGGADGVDDGEIGAGSQRARVVDGQRAEQTGQGPVEDAVLEDVEDGHRVGRELVNKQRLELALDEVGNDHAEAEPLGEGHGLGRGASISVDVRPSGDDEDVDQDRAQVLDEEDGAPGNLRAEVLDEHLAGGGDILLVKDAGLAVLERLPGRRVEEADAVVVANLGRLGDELLEVLDSGLGRELDRRREPLDGLLRRCKLFR